MTVDVFATRNGELEMKVFTAVPPGLTGYNDTFSLRGGKCEADIHVVARTADGRVVAERTGMCRREIWEIGAPT